MFLDAVIKNASDTLRDQYIASRFAVADDDWPPYQPKHYTTLAFTHYKKKESEAKVFSFTRELAI